MTQKSKNKTMIYLIMFISIFIYLTLGRFIDGDDSLLILHSASSFCLKTIARD